MPLLQFKATRADAAVCPFANPSVEFTLERGSCVRLAGPSGCGKSTLATFISGLSSLGALRRLGIEVESCAWDPTVPARERCGALFQSTTLLDSLTVAGNVAVALASSSSSSSLSTSSSSSFTLGPTVNGSDDARLSGAALTRRVKQLVEAVGLDFARDAHKRPSELSGGMARRASLALQLAQRKRVVVLDEPFTGLDSEAAASVANELRRLRTEHGTALILISHEPDVVALLMGDDQDGPNVPKERDEGWGEKGRGGGRKGPSSSSGGRGGGGEGSTLVGGRSGDGAPAWGLANVVVTLSPAARCDEGDDARALFGGTSLAQRFALKVVDYVGWSLPLVALALAAAGVAVALLSADLLRRVDVTEPVLRVIDREVRPLLAMVAGGDGGRAPMLLAMVKTKVRAMLTSAVPEAKAAIYATGMAKLFVLEVGPLLTALLLCGRIGGAYAGEVASMQASHQNKLLRTLGVSPVAWSLVPALGAALVAGPVLTVAGTAVAVALGALPLLARSGGSGGDVDGGSGGALYLGTVGSYRAAVRAAVFPPFVRLPSDLATNLGPSVEAALRSCFNRGTAHSGGVGSGGGSGVGSGVGSGGGSDDAGDDGFGFDGDCGDGGDGCFGFGEESGNGGDGSGGAVSEGRDGAGFRGFGSVGLDVGEGVGEGDGEGVVDMPCAWLGDAAVELATYPPCFCVLKAATFALLVLLVAEACARSRPDLTTRGVPGVITAAVVGGGLAVIFADWGFSQLLLLRTW